MQRAALVGLVLLGAAGSAAGQPPDTTERPAKASSYSAVGWASWYGREFHGRRTADGETFDMGGLTAAHKTMPLPCYARVTNLRNGRSMVVRVNDRGPFVGDRLIDVSARVANLLDFQLAINARGSPRSRSTTSAWRRWAAADEAGAAGEPENARFARRRRQPPLRRRGRSSPPSRRRDRLSPLSRPRRRSSPPMRRRRRQAASSPNRARWRRRTASRNGPARTVSLDVAAAAARRSAAFALRGTGSLALRRPRAVARRSGGVAVADGGNAPLGALAFRPPSKTKGRPRAPFAWRCRRAAQAARSVTRPSSSRSCRAPSAPRRECRRAKRPSRPSRTGRSLPSPRPLRAP